jgi:uncharacterized protein
VKRIFFLLLGFFSVALGTIGIFLPLLPTVPLMILAAFCFARSSPALERRIVEHPGLKPHIAAWRERGAISRKGKAAALVAFTASALVGILALHFPAMLLPVAAALIGGGWILTRPTA